MEFQKHTKEEALLIIKELVERFRLNEKSYKNNTYDESNTRTDFIDKFFEALNWDVRNDNGDAEQFRDVVREDKVSIEGKAKAPDYSFRIKGTRVFFVEAKKPSVNIKNDVEPAYQVRRYAYTAKLPISILTDFEEFAIYETNKKPKPSDAASKHRPYFFTYNEYEKKFDFLWETLSYDAVRKGSLDRFCDNSKRGTGEIDDELLATIEQWREELAKNIALRNSALSLRNLNTAVQKIIDRIVFLRIAEDKDMEEYETLKRACAANDAYKELRKVFDFANKKYNSGLFASEDWLNNLVIDSNVLKDIASELYYPNCPYAWVALPIEILGNIYEKFLGSEITFRNVKGGHTVQVEQKPEVKKAGGVYYTPQYIVEYIVKQTVARKLEGKSPKQIKGLTICDPACGSGSFLVGAYKYLMDWHLAKYSESEEELARAKKQGNVVETSNGLSLSLKEKQRILTTHIYGVDIDAQAVEVTKLSLFLQMLDGEGKQYINNSLSLFRESDLHVLPNLGDNIKCGNSLIGSDFYNSQELNLFDDDAIYKINAFDWDKEFPEIFKNGGFECVIGNPPYVNISIMPEYHKYFLQKYPTIHTGYNDLMYYFLYKGILILNEKGTFGVITSNYFVGNDYATKLRVFLNSKITDIVNFHRALIFKDANVHTALVFADKKVRTKNVNFFDYTQDKAPAEVNLTINYNKVTIKRENLGETWIVADSIDSKIMTKMESGAVLLGKITDIAKGPETGKNGVFSVKKEIVEKYNIEQEVVRKCIKNSHIQRYSIKEVDLWLLYSDNDFSKEKFPNAYAYLELFKKDLLNRRGPKKGEYSWWRLHRPSEKKIYDAKEKIIVPYRSTKNRFAYDNQQFFNDGGDIRALVVKEGAPYKIKYLLAVLNSSLIDWYYGFIGKAKGDSREYFNKPLAKIPIKKATSAQQEALSNLADQMMVAVKKQHEAVSEQEKRVADTLVSAIDNQINQKVYELYGITDPNDIAVIEGESE